MNKFRIYLAGSMEYSPDKGRGWREVVENYYGKYHPEILVHNPVKIEDSKLEPFKSRQEFADSKIVHGLINPDHVTVTRRFIKMDLKAVKKSNLVILYFEGVPSWGSAGEITVAYEHKIPIVTILKEGTILENVPSWVLGCSDFVIGLTHFTFDDILTGIMNVVL